MNRRFNVLLVLAILLGAVIGGVAGDRVLATDEVEKKTLERFANLVDVVEASYPVEVDSEKVVYGAIRGMLRTLDPHSNFLDPKTYRSMREEQSGHFSGLGIVVTKKGDRLTVISPIADTPASRLGIRAGDIIAKIEGDATNELTLDEAVGRLKGPRGTQVSITINRIGREPFDLTITRDDIPTKSLTRSFIIAEETGYVRLKNFTRTTYDELTAALDDLEGQGMKSLILDLRGNPGGLLDQAVKIADLFVEKSQTIVYTEGRLPDSNTSFSARHGQHGDYPVVVLVNHGSASASEIVAGAIQDHDRGLIVGQTTWGKGLVQSVYSLQHDAGLALTTAKYYTPAGRSIQRDYSTSFEEYYEYDPTDGPLRDPSLMVRTDAGRTVYGGGGIEPDEIIEPREMSEVELELERKDVFFKFAVEFSARNEVPRDFVADEKVIEEFQAFATKEGVTVDIDSFVTNISFIKVGLEERVVAAAYDLEEGSRRAVTNDPSVKRAIELMPDAEALRTTGQPLVASQSGDAEPKKSNEVLETAY